MPFQTLLCHPFVVSVVVFVLSLDTSLASDLELDQIVNLKNTGGIGCLIIVHPEVERCKTKYTKRVSDVIEAGNPMDSEEYRREFCCGFWSLRDCVADSARQKCDKRSAKTIGNMPIYSSEHENVLSKKCDGFLYESRQCSAATNGPKTISLWTLMSVLLITLLLIRR